MLVHLVRLLLYATRMMRTEVERAEGGCLQRAMSGPVQAALAGTLVAFDARSVAGGDGDFSLNRAVGQAGHILVAAIGAGRRAGGAGAGHDARGHPRHRADPFP